MKKIEGVKILYKIEDIKNTIICGDALSELKKIPDCSIDTIICSPPYWRLRAYGTNPQIWDGDKNCEHEWNNYIQNPKGGKGSKCANVGANKNLESI